MPTSKLDRDLAEMDERNAVLDLVRDGERIGHGAAGRNSRLPNVVACTVCNAPVPRIAHWKVGTKASFSKFSKACRHRSN